MKETVITLPELMAMNSKELQKVMGRGHALDPEILGERDGRQYLGVDLSLPGWARKVLWHTFRKTFVKDNQGVRGWNVKMEQRGIDGPQVPLRNKDGSTKTFGHYRVSDARGIYFPGGWAGSNFLDYTQAGNPVWDLAGLGYTPLIAVNKGSQDLLLGWEIFKIGPAKLPMPLHWALRYDGPLEEVVPPPRPTW